MRTPWLERIFAPILAAMLILSLLAQLVKWVWGLVFR